MADNDGDDGSHGHCDDGSVSWRCLSPLPMLGFMRCESEATSPKSWVVRGAEKAGLKSMSTGIRCEWPINVLFL